MSLRGKSAWIATTVAALIAFGPAAAEAGKTAKAKTNVKVITVTSDPDFVYVLGAVSSGEKRCLDNRRVKVDFAGDGGKFAFDVARTGRNGGWDAVHDADETIAAGPFNKVLVEVAERKIKAGKKTIRCSSASTVYPLAD